MTKENLKLRWKNTLLVFQEQLEKRNFKKRMENSTPLTQPFYKYKGVLGIDKEKIEFFGEEKKSGEYFKLKIPFEKIEEAELGCEDSLSQWEKTNFLPNKPLKIKYKEVNEAGEKQERIIYIFANFHSRFKIIKKSNNKAVHKNLRQFINPS